MSDKVNLSALNTKVELLLRKSGLIVYDINDSGTTSAGFRLYLNVGGYEIDDYRTVYQIELVMYNNAVVCPIFANAECNPYIATITVWTKELMGFAGNAKLEEGVTNSSVELVDSFINDWLKANPLAQNN